MRVVQQTSDNDCGLAAIAMLLQLHGQQVSLYELKMRHPISTAGASILDLKAIAKQHHLDTRVFSLKASADQLESLQTPFIAYWGGQHFTVVTRIAKGRMHLADPREGLRDLPLEDALREWSGVAIYMQPDADFDAKPRPGLVRTWLPELRAFWPMLLALLVLSGVLLATSYGVPLVVSRLVSNYMEHGQLPFDAAGLAAICLGFMTAFYLFNWARQRLLLEVRLKLESALSERFTGALFRLPYAFFNRMPFGDLLERLGSVGAIREFVSSRLASAIIDGVLVSVLAVMVLITSHKLGILYLASAAVVAQLVYLAWPRLRERFRDEVLAYTANFDNFSDALMGIQDIKVNHTEQVFYQRWQQRLRSYLGAARLRGLLTARLEATLAVLGGGVPLIVLLASLWLVDRAQLNPGDALLAYLLVQYSMSSLIGLLGTGIMLQQLVIHSDRVQGINDFVREYGRDDGEQGAARVDRVSLEQCSFSYTPGGREVLSQLSLEIGGGGLIVVLGASGSGKSTLLKLLSRTLAPSAGRVRYFSEGQELEPGQAAQLSSLIQDAALFRGTVMENITLFDASIPIERVAEAARLACIHDEILALPQGYSTAVERGGANLSGGQRQRLALARALLKRPGVLVLDEFSSHLDAENERRIVSYLRQLDCTVVIATHRTAWIQPQDRVFQLREGRAQALTDFNAAELRYA
jgi:ATP-binding cassette subfamily B protein